MASDREIDAAIKAWINFELNSQYPNRIEIMKAALEAAEKVREEKDVVAAS